jgi:hypothetical protein
VGVLFGISPPIGAPGPIPLRVALRRVEVLVAAQHLDLPQVRACHRHPRRMARDDSLGSPAATLPSTSMAR